MGAGVMSCSTRALLAFIAGVLIASTIADASLVEPMDETQEGELVQESDALPAYLQKMKDSVHQQEHKEEEARQKYSQATALPAYLQKMKDSVHQQEHKEEEARQKYSQAKAKAESTSMVETKTDSKAAMGAKAQFEESMAHMKKLRRIWPQGQRVRGSLSQGRWRVQEGCAGGT